MFLSIEQLKQECIKAMKLKEGKVKEFNFVRDEVWNLDSGRRGYIYEIEKKTK
jgi:hypothetical protein